MGLTFNTIKEETIISKHGDVIKVTLEEVKDEEFADLDIDLTTYNISVRCETFDYLNSNKVYGLKTNAEKSYKRTIHQIKNSWVY